RAVVPARAGRRGRATGGPRGEPRRRAHRGAPVHQGPAGPGARHPHVRGAAARGLPALAERALGVLLLRGVLARLPPGRLPARAALVLPARAPPRALTPGTRR